MSRTRIIVLVGFVAAFAAGVAVGLVMGRLTAWPPGGRPHGPSWLAHELNLSPEQQKQMREIWSEVMDNSWEKQREQMDALKRQRDDGVRALLTDPQKAEYEKVMKEYSEKSAAMATARDKVFEEAVERTKRILTESQRKKYDELLKRRGEWGRGEHHGPKGGGKHGGPPPPPPPPPKRDE